MNDNLILSQDENQKAIYAGLNIRRSYDAMNRLLTIGYVKLPDGGVIGTGPMGDTLLSYEFDNPLPADSLFIINVYDTITNTSYGSVFSQWPNGYSAANFTRTRLAATAFRTLLGENWSFKFYRYDERGNITKMWVKLAGMDSMKTMDYKYNSQNMMTNLYYQYQKTGWKYYAWYYDAAGRLSDAGLLAYQGGIGIGNEVEGVEAPTEEDLDDPQGYWQYQSLAKYRYNSDQQIDSILLNNSSVNLKHTYNNRNWLRYMYRTSTATFATELRYNPNGNIRNHRVYGSYNSGLGELDYNYTYDNSNRLLKANRDSAQTSQSSHDLIMNYDKDGNFKSLKRYGANNNLVDNFTYTYFSGKNRLKNVTSSNEQFSYDGNGNVIIDSIKQNYLIKYDWRNLITEIRRWRIEPGGSPGGEPPPDLWIYKANYWYDEAGNRICKKVSQWYEQVLDPGVQEIAEFPEEGDGSGGFWQVLSTTYYLRDVTGREVAIYSGNSVEQWNLLGLDNFGNVNSSGDKFFYLKDHLGTIRAVLDADNNVIEADDYDAWGHPLDGRCSYIGAYLQRYKFTSKERDRESSIDETGYDYFGARFYDSRIGRWGGVEPKLDNYLHISPYSYSLNNPIILIDPNGRDPRRNQMANLSEIVDMLTEHMNEDLNNFITSELPGDESLRYVYTEEGGFIDLMHFFAAAEVSSSVAKYDPTGIVAFSTGLTLGNFVELFQSIKADDSQWDPEDLPSNVQGAKFGVELGGETKITETFILKFVKKMTDDKILDKDDPKIARDKVRIREDKNDYPLKERYSYSPYHGDPVGERAKKGN